MKKRVWIPLVALLLGTAMLFTACSAYGKIEKAFTDAGYEKSETPVLTFLPACAAGIFLLKALSQQMVDF